MEKKKPHQHPKNKTVLVWKTEICVKVLPPQNFLDHYDGCHTQGDRAYGHSNHKCNMFWSLHLLGGSTVAL